MPMPKEYVLEGIGCDLEARGPGVMSAGLSDLYLRLSAQTVLLRIVVGIPTVFNPGSTCPEPFTSRTKPKELCWTPAFQKIQALENSLIRAKSSNLSEKPQGPTAPRLVAPEPKPLNPKP